MEINNTNNNKNSIYYGDIIKIISPENDETNNKYFFIKYIDTDKGYINAIDIYSNSPKQFFIEEGKFTDETITNIYIVFRHKVKGYARINNLIPGKYVEIKFNTQPAHIITCKITELFQNSDMIELKQVNTNEYFYINFNYKEFQMIYLYRILKLLMGLCMKHSS